MKSLQLIETGLSFPFSKSVGKSHFITLAGAACYRQYRVRELNCRSIFSGLKWPLSDILYGAGENHEAEDRHFPSSSNSATLSQSDFF